MRAEKTGGRRRAVLTTLVVAGLAMTILLAASPTPAGAVHGVEEFYARVSSKTVTCAIYDGYLDQHEALCEYDSPHAVAKATLGLDGSVVLCRSRPTSNRCELGNAGDNARTYGRGKTVTVGHFACTVLGAGVRCTVSASGKGFLLGPKQLRGVGGATVHHH